ncbi:hypothetical protein HYV88_03820 [Candidatus Woesearchaeota archaeon]|nr:hypothetical protein [Candidatus Woesearchaeota archaeon]
MWWPFSFKKTTEKSTISESSVKKSFSNVKKDMQEIKTKTDSNTEEIKKINTKIIQLESSISNLNQNIILFNKTLPVEEEILETKIPSSLNKENTKKLWDNLTNLQKSMLINIKLLLDEEGKKWVPMKYLAQELYPEKTYPDIKAMISNYTDLLLEHGLLLKRRKGRETYLSLTEKALPFIPKKELKVKQKEKR